MIYSNTKISTYKTSIILSLVLILINSGVIYSSDTTKVNCNTFFSVYGGAHINYPINTNKLQNRWIMEGMSIGYKKNITIAPCFGFKYNLSKKNMLFSVGLEYFNKVSILSTTYDTVINYYPNNNNYTVKSKNSLHIISGTLSIGYSHKRISIFGSSKFHTLVFNKSSYLLADRTKHSNTRVAFPSNELMFYFFTPSISGMYRINKNMFLYIAIDYGEFEDLYYQLSLNLNLIK